MAVKIASANVPPVDIGEFGSEGSQRGIGGPWRMTGAGLTGTRLMFALDLMASICRLADKGAWTGRPMSFRSYAIDGLLAAAVAASDPNSLSRCTPRACSLELAAASSAAMRASTISRSSALRARIISCSDI